MFVLLNIKGWNGSNSSEQRTKQFKNRENVYQSACLALCLHLPEKKTLLKTRSENLHFPLSNILWHSCFLLTNPPVGCTRNITVCQSVIKKNNMCSSVSIWRRQHQMSMTLFDVLLFFGDVLHQTFSENRETETGKVVLQAAVVFRYRLTLGWTLGFDSHNPISRVNNYKIITPVQHHLGSIPWSGFPPATCVLNVL